MKAALLLVTSLVLLVGCSRSHDQIADSTSFTVLGTPSTVYDRTLPAISARLRSGTRVVRTDDPGIVTMRFSVAAEDRSVRLVDVILKRTAQGTEVFVHSKKFSIILSADRDKVDLSVETAILGLFKKEPNQPPEPTVMLVTPRAGARVAPSTTVAHL